MVLRLLSKLNKPGISYLLIVLAFVLLVLGVFIFFKFRIKLMEKEKLNQVSTQTEQLQLIISKSAYHDHHCVFEKNNEEI